MGLRCTSAQTSSLRKRRQGITRTGKAAEPAKPTSHAAGAQTMQRSATHVRPTTVQIVAHTLFVYGPGVPLPAMKEAAATFQRKHGVAVQVTGGPTPQWLMRARRLWIVPAASSSHQLSLYRTCTQVVHDLFQLHRNENMPDHANEFAMFHGVSAGSGIRIVAGLALIEYRERVRLHAHTYHHQPASELAPRGRTSTYAQMLANVPASETMPFVRMNQK